MENFIGEPKSREKKSSGNSRGKTGSNSTMNARKSVLVLSVCDCGSQDWMAEHKNHKNMERKNLQFRNNLVNDKKTLLFQKAIYVSLQEKVIIDGNFSINGFNSTIDTQKRG